MLRARYVFFCARVTSSFAFLQGLCERVVDSHIIIFSTSEVVPSSTSKLNNEMNIFANRIGSFLRITTYSSDYILLTVLQLLLLLLHVLQTTRLAAGQTEKYRSVGLDSSQTPTFYDGPPQTVDCMKEKMSNICRYRRPI